ncbi:MAG TPA: hypothetical protein VMF67_00465 [Rhizomicrobium sp.]|nr:hypothetical protein [Rhizomicrobium sp.]
MTKNAEVESKIAHRLPDFLREVGILPQGYQCDVHLHRGNRKKRNNAEFEGNWDPDTDSIRIAFSPMEEEDELVATEGPASKSVTPTHTEDRLLELLRALDRAENRPGYEFVSLKWFRDTALPHEGFSWAADEAIRHDVLREAIDRRWILTSKVANPRPPNFPVTTIRSNRLMPEVNAALGGQNSGPPGFRPVRIRGESLSATVQHDRR